MDTLHIQIQHHEKSFYKLLRMHIGKKLKDEISNNPFYSISNDKSSNKTKVQHLIIYITYLTNEGRGQCVTKFINLLQNKDGTS